LQTDAFPAIQLNERSIISTSPASQSPNNSTSDNMSCTMALEPHVNGSRSRSTAKRNDQRTIIASHRSRNSLAQRPQEAVSMRPLLSHLAPIIELSEGDLGALNTAFAPPEEPDSSQSGGIWSMWGLSPIPELPVCARTEDLDDEWRRASQVVSSRGGPLVKSSPATLVESSMSVSVKRRWWQQSHSVAEDVT
jgi:hypothetical protein